MFKQTILCICTVALLGYATQKNISTDNIDAITIPKILNYQGKLTNTSGNPVADSAFSITFSLYTSSTGGNAFWTETQNVQTQNGLFNVLLGSSTSIESVPQSGNCYLEMQVNPNPVMTPRIRITSSAYAFLAKKADTANYALSANIQYVDSARISANAHNAYKLQGKDTIALSSKFVDEGQLNSVTSSMITDNTITRNDVATNFKAPYADSADYVRNINVIYVDSARISTNSYKLQGKDTIALSNKFVDENQTNAISNSMLQNNSVTTDKIQDSTITRADVVRNFKSPYSDTADFARSTTGISYIDSSRISVNAYNAYKLQGKDTSALDLRYVNENQNNSISSAMIIDGAIIRDDVISTFKSPFSDTADYARSTPPVGVIDSARVAVNAYNAYKLQGKDTITLSAKFVDEGQVNAISSLMIQDTAVTNSKLAPNAVSTDKILNGTIGTLDIEDGAITTDKIDRDAVTTNEIQDSTIQMSDLSFIPANRPFSPLISGSEIAVPCTLQGYVGSPPLTDAFESKDVFSKSKRSINSAILNIKNTGDGDGINIISSGGNGIFIDSVYNNGIFVNRADNGVYINRSSGTGVYVDSVAVDGFNIGEASNGLLVMRARNIGAYINRASYDGVFVDSAGAYGVKATGASGGVWGKSENGIGVKATSTTGNALVVEGPSQFSGQIVSTASDDKAAPISVTSTATCPNLNADLLDGQHASSFMSTASDYGRSGVASDLYEGTTTLTNKYVNEGQTNAINSAMITDASILGRDISLPCTLVTNTSITSGVINIRNDGTGEGLRIDSSGGHGIRVSKSTGDGIRISNAGGQGVNIANAGANGVFIQQANQSGVNIDRAGIYGIYIRRTNSTGIYVDSASCGLYVNQSGTYAIGTGKSTGDGLLISDAGRYGLSVWKAVSDGIYIDSAYDGVHIRRANDEGLYMGRTTNNGISINRAGDNGVFVDSAANVGFYVNRCDTGLKALRTKDIGVYIDSANHGIKINKTHGTGISILRPSPGDAIFIDSASNGIGINMNIAAVGIHLDRTSANGIYVRRAGDNGVYIDSVADVGFYVNRCDTGLVVMNAVNNGIYMKRVGFRGVQIDTADNDGINIGKTGFSGIYINRTGSRGMWLGKCTGDGIFVDSSGLVGVVARGAVGAGEFVALNAAARGIRVFTYNSDPNDTAIYAYGKGLATGGWATATSDGEAPCIISPEMTMIASGTAKLIGGQISISFPDIFRNNIRTDIPIRITVTPKEEPTGLLYVNQTKSDGFGVRLKQISGWGDKTDLTFDWIAVGTLKEPKTTPEAKAEWDKMMNR